MYMKICSKTPNSEYDEGFDRIFRGKKMKIYLAGPMRGIKDFNFPAFFRVAEELRSQGHEVFNPAERDINAFGEESLKSETGSEQEVVKKLGKSGLWLARNCFLEDTRYICAEADAIYLLPGWMYSRGAQAEKALCEAIGLEIMYGD
jgi:hypothetical protein